MVELDSFMDLYFFFYLCHRINFSFTYYWY